MNIDERLEALTHSVELIAAMHRDTEKETGELRRLVIQIAEGTARLLNTVESHEHRIGDLESRQSS